MINVPANTTSSQFKYNFISRGTSAQTTHLQKEGGWGEVMGDDHMTALAFAEVIYNTGAKIGKGFE